MKKSGILHAELSRQIALLGHTDLIAVADSGLPLPRSIPVIDLAMAPGMVPFTAALDVLLSELVVQRHTVAHEAFGEVAGQWISQRAGQLGEQVTVLHEELKAMLPRMAFAVRTGEQSPYANVILECGVPF
ncbi:D-ribose pyranase [Dermatophilus congolensis]|uniref:D-ribose pyranase n=1 Tax=Dermatophilus congolensis TaxID=1863 RepID=UPI001AAEB4C4|nr:D-ribose pyranase [Dermatophilus congolensis]MBO3150976.1 D-ribose pyranase [Dermatophilus congolensis]MBO3162019.1 D-ribose pyranase [Dermatophilus congolensis]MBO3162260.1 D-ribose pyranase [Dermatophilus congolensis]MBO3175815.1 D-ribose pyranase [Dermatophilus congolensis]